MKKKKFIVGILLNLTLLSTSSFVSTASEDFDFDINNEIQNQKLDELKNYLSQALNQAKKYLFEKTEMTQEKFILFIKENEQKLKDNVLDIDSENNESTLSTNLGASLFEDELTKNNFIRKRKRDEKIEKNNQDNNIKQKA